MLLRSKDKALELLEQSLKNLRTDYVVLYALKERLRFWFGNKDLAMKRYSVLDKKADSCTECGTCMSKCPYQLDIIRKLPICDYKLAGRDIY